MVCEETVKAKPTENDSGFIIFPNKIQFSVIWLDSSGYLINQQILFVKEQAVSRLKKSGITKKVIKIRKISGKRRHLNS